MFCIELDQNIVAKSSRETTCLSGVGGGMRRFLPCVLLGYFKESFFTVIIGKISSSCVSIYRYLILVATSGDTGGAVLDGFSRHAGK